MKHTINVKKENFFKIFINTLFIGQAIKIKKLSTLSSLFKYFIKDKPQVLLFKNLTLTFNKINKEYIRNSLYLFYENNILFKESEYQNTFTLNNDFFNDFNNSNKIIINYSTTASKLSYHIIKRVIHFDSPSNLFPDILFYLLNDIKKEHRILLSANKIIQLFVSNGNIPLSPSILIHKNGFAQTSVDYFKHSKFYNKKTKSLHDNFYQIFLHTKIIEINTID